MSLNKFFGLILIIVFLTQTGTTQDSAMTPVFQQFVEAKKNGTEPILPDFSYSGYHRGDKPIPAVEGPLFDITEYGAIPDDGISDKDAIREAIKAAQENGGGVIFFPPGQFLINTDSDEKNPIKIQKGNIVLRGSGYADGGTVLKSVNHFDPLDPEKKYTTPHAFHVIPEIQPDEETLATIVESSARETFSVRVDDAEKLEVGDWITLSLQSVEAVPEFLEPFTAEEKFTRVNERGILVHERHTIKAIEGNKITFHQPLHVNVNSEYEWRITNYPVIEEFGIEDICFMGGWEQDFVHHRSALDDGGWSAIRVEQAANSWIRRCAFINWNYCIDLRFCSNFSALNLVALGNKAHYSTHTREGYGVLLGFVDDRAGHHHGPSVGYRSSGAVFWNISMLPDQRMDSHSGLPIATLHDRTKGGVLYGSGGPWAGMPHHLRHFILWNFYHPSDAYDHYDFWRLGEKDRFVMPIVVGMHGNTPSFNEDHLELIESHGKQVHPSSLYEAQLELRLGKTPEWVEQAKSEAEKMKTATYPDHVIYDPEKN